MSIRTYVYIDGFNLYYGLLKKHPETKWLDLRAFVKAFLPERYEVAKIYYFTAKVESRPSNIDTAKRQGLYLKALETLPDVEVIEGFYRVRRVKLPLAEDETSFVEVLRAEEKRTDVNIASHMLKDAFNHQAAHFVLVSGDSDLTAPVTIIRKVAQKPVAVYDPHPKNICHELRRHATFYRTLELHTVFDKRLPERILLKSGREIFCPPEWHEV